MDTKLASSASHQQVKNDQPVCELASVTKQFGGTVACRTIDFEVRAGEVHGLVGENGAGKSTLMKILHGVYQPDSGEVRIRGESVRFQSPRDAEHRGIVMIPQELALDTKRLIQLMIGRPLDQLFVHAPHEAGEILLEVRSASRRQEFRGISFCLRRGEIVGLGGLIGAGRSKLAQAISGTGPIDSGEILVRRKNTAVRSVKDAKRAGIAYVPEERKSQGLLPPLSAKANVSYSSLGRLGRFGFVNEKKETALAQRFCDLLMIRGGTLNAAVERLSGGNQQKAVISKILALDPEIILLDEPTRGVDIGAKSEIYRIIDGLAKDGKAVLLISSEMNELLAMADRLLVMHEGVLTGEFRRDAVTAENIAAAAPGIEVQGVLTYADRNSLKNSRRRSNPLPQYLETLLKWAPAPPLIFLLVLLGSLLVSTPGFASFANLRSIIDQVAVLGIVALAVNMVILSGEIDVSAGSLLAVCSFVYGNIAMRFGGSLAPLGASLAAGLLLGAANGLLVTIARVPSIIATLGTLMTLRGAVLLYGADQVINLSPGSRTLGLGSFSGISVSALVLLLVFALFWFLGRHSTWGREVFAVGGNLRAAQLAGLPILTTKLWCFIFSGLACGLASAVFIGQIGELQATAATGFELRVVAAVVLGGTSIAGGRGSIFAPIVGALLIGVILNGMTLNRVPGLGSSWL